MSTWRASNLRLRRKPSVQSRSKTSFGELVRVAITQFDLDPTIFERLIQPSLEIGISHIDEMIASKYAARTNFVLHENAEDLASYFFIRCHVIRPLRVSNRRSHKLNTTASDGMESYPSCPFRKSRPAWESHRWVESSHDRGRCSRSSICSQCSSSTSCPLLAQTDLARCLPRCPLSSYRPFGRGCALRQPVFLLPGHRLSVVAAHGLVVAEIYCPTTFRSASLILSCQPGPAS